MRVKCQPSMEMWAAKTQHKQCVRRGGPEMTPTEPRNWRERPRRSSGHCRKTPQLGECQRSFAVTTQVDRLKAFSIQYSASTPEQRPFVNRFILRQSRQGLALLRNSAYRPSCSTALSLAASRRLVYIRHCVYMGHSEGHRELREAWRPV